ncbi:MAG: hypothetical protein ACXWQO_03470 [Bdellovibrionota bacterium]
MPCSGKKLIQIAIVTVWVVGAVAGFFLLAKYSGAPVQSSVSREIAAVKQ